MRRDFRVDLFFYNPNISPIHEYTRRKNELIRFASAEGLRVFEGVRNQKEWTLRVKDFAVMGERSIRCRECFQIRMEETFRKAVEYGYDTAGTVLGISPHKNLDMLRDAGYSCEKKFGVAFLDIDFRKDNGQMKAAEISRKYDFYRQNYCGCVYSLLERKPDSGWARKVKDHIGNGGSCG
jgi:predicted adenine nucleotide alpha hydrolase (AANH) superfamily ATPase